MTSPLPAGSTTLRADQFLTCSPECFVRRFVIPLHRAKADFMPEGDLRIGRIDVAVHSPGGARVIMLDLLPLSHLFPTASSGSKHDAAVSA